MRVDQSWVRSLGLRVLSFSWPKLGHYTPGEECQEMFGLSFVTAFHCQRVLCDWISRHSHDANNINFNWCLTSGQLLALLSLYLNL